MTDTAPDDLKSRVEAFLTRTGMAASTFGQSACGDPNFVTDLRNGREARSATRERVELFMESYRPPGSQPAKDATGKQGRAA